MERTATGLRAEAEAAVAATPRYTTPPARLTCSRRAAAAVAAGSAKQGTGDTDGGSGGSAGGGTNSGAAATAGGGTAGANGGQSGMSGSAGGTNLSTGGGGGGGGGGCKGGTGGGAATALNDGGGGGGAGTSCGAAPLTYVGPTSTSTMPYSAGQAGATLSSEYCNGDVTCVGGGYVILGNVPVATPPSIFVNLGNNQTFAQGEVIPVSFTCTEGSGPGLADCYDSLGNPPLVGNNNNQFESLGTNSFTYSGDTLPTASAGTSLTFTVYADSWSTGGGTVVSDTITYAVSNTAPPVTLPTVAADGASCTHPGSNGWCAGTETATFKVTTGSGAVSTPCVAASGGATCTFNVSSTGDGPDVMLSSGNVCDANSNCAIAVTQGPFEIDSTAPVISLRPAGDVCSVPGNGGWCRGSQTAGFSVSDATSGLSVTSGSPCTASHGVACNFTQSTTTQGSSVSISSGEVCDVAGNCATAINAGPYEIDSTAPVISRNPAGDKCSLAGNSGWCRGSQTAGFSVSDATSGTSSPCAAPGGSSCTFAQFTTTQGSSVSISSGTVCDVAGNCATAINAGPYKIDSTAPSITATATANSAPYSSDTWTKYNVIVHFACTDTLSGVAPGTTTSDQTVSTEGSGQSATGSCSDVAGNIASATFANIQIDKTPPVITFSGNVVYGILQTVDVTCIATDALSGVASTTCPGPLASGPASGFSSGSHTVSASATDNVGNFANVSTSFSIVVTAADLGKLATQDVDGSTAYSHLSPAAQRSLNSQVAGYGSVLGAINPHGFAPFNNGLLAIFEIDIGFLVQDGYLTRTQAAALETYAATLL